jgi:integrase
MFSVKVYCRKDAVSKEGKCSLFLRIVYKRKIKTAKLGFKISYQNWNEKKEIVTNAEPLAQDINFTIATIKNNCQLRFYETLRNNEKFCFGDILQHAKKTTYTNFLEYATSHINSRDVSETTKRTLHIAAMKLDRFKPGVNVSEIDDLFMEKYKKYLSVTLNNQNNTVVCNLIRIKTILNAAIADKIIKESPFEKFKVGGYTNKQVVLTSVELENIAKCYDTLEKKIHREIVRQFLFSCYTGLRYSDIIKLKYEDLRQTQKGFYFDIIQHKTKQSVIVPLTNFALKYINYNKKSGKIFTTYTTQYFNKELKKVLVSIDIKRSITSHVARHTFITISMQMGMRKELISKIVGHRKLSTTEGYTHLNTNDLFNEMQKWL